MSVRELQIHWSGSPGDGVAPGQYGAIATRLILAGRAIATSLFRKLPQSRPESPKKIFVRCTTLPDPRHFGQVGRSFEVEIPFDFVAAKDLVGAALNEVVASHLVAGLARVSDITGWSPGILAVAKDAAEQDGYGYSWSWPNKKVRAADARRFAYLACTHGPERFSADLVVVRKNGEQLTRVAPFVTGEPHEVRFMPMLGSLSWNGDTIELRDSNTAVVASSVCPPLSIK